MGPCCVDREAVAWKGSAIGPEWGQELAQVGWGPGHPSHSWTGLLRAGNSEGVAWLGGGGGGCRILQIYKPPCEPKACVLFSALVGAMRRADPQAL